MAFLAVILFLSVFLNCQHNNEYIYKRFIVGGPCEIKFYHHNEKETGFLIDTIALELVRIDSLLNRFSDQSLVSRLNRQHRIQASADIIRIFALSDSVARLTDGLFDISVAPLLEIWGFYAHQKQIPDSSTIIHTRKLVNYQRIVIKGDSIIIPDYMAIDLGGIAQGFAADRIAAILRRHRVKSAVINIAGEIVAIGRSPEGRAWRIGIKDPRGPGIIETITLENGAVSTSGDYEKFFMIDGKRFSHIINPRTGVPASDFASVTILAQEAGFTDALATAVAVMGAEKGVKFLDSLGIRGIIYYEEAKTLKRMESR